MLITESYRELNRQLHVQNPTYGISGARYADIVRKLSDMLGTKDILDYGCGKRTLERDLGFKIENYDPAIRGLDQSPMPADIVVCTDVLEHVEPELLDSVLRDLVKLTKREVVISVHTGPAMKTLADGRNAHLIQQDPDWWLANLRVLFRHQRSFALGEKNFVFIGQSLKETGPTPDLTDVGPPPTVKTIAAKSVYTDDQRITNIRSSMLRALPSIKVLPPHDKTMVLACYGPSLEDTLDELRREKGDIFTVSGAHDFLLSHGIKPMAHIEADPRPHKAKLINMLGNGICYFLASACDRSVFSKLHGEECWIYHVTSSDKENTYIAGLDPFAFTVDGGTNVGMNAIGLGTVLGYRRFSIYGMDGSFRAPDWLVNWPNDKDLPDNIRQYVQCHTGAHPNEDQQIMRVWVDGRPFMSSPQMFQGAQDFVMTKSSLRHCSFQLHGDGFVPALVNHISGLRKKAA